MKNETENETQYRKALEFIVANSLYQDAWYVKTALAALGEHHQHNERNTLILEK